MAQRSEGAGCFRLAQRPVLQGSTPKGEPEVSRSLDAGSAETFADPPGACQAMRAEGRPHAQVRIRPGAYSTAVEADESEEVSSTAPTVPSGVEIRRLTGGFDHERLLCAAPVPDRS